MFSLVRLVFAVCPDALSIWVIIYFLTLNFPNTTFVAQPCFFGIMGFSNLNNISGLGFDRDSD